MNPTNSVRQKIHQLRDFIEERIIGQTRLVERLLLTLLCDGHLIVEGAPGLAKTRAIKTLAQGIEGDFHRVQFTPDLLPSDLTGTEIYRPQEGTFSFRQGPLFNNLVLADEINRAPAKVQSALLEAMAERQITIGRKSYSLPDLYMVMATQNPLEQEGPYPLPEAQLDRFLLHVNVDYPDPTSERKILELGRDENLFAPATQTATPALNQLDITTARKELMGTYMSKDVEDYLLELIFATRNPKSYGEDLSSWQAHGASPRATLAIDPTARALAWLNNKDYVSPADIQNVAPDVLRHRVILSYEAAADGVTADIFLSELIDRVAVP